MEITKATVLQMDWATIKANIKNPSLQNLLRDREVAVHVSNLMQEIKEREEAVDAQLSRVVPPSTEQLAQEAQQLADAAVVEAPLEAEPAAAAAVAPAPYEAEDASLRTVGVTVVRDASGNPTRYIEEYQVLGEDGKPIGRPTHLESRTLAEHFAKQREVHTQATRAFHRLKQQKLTATKNQTPRTVLTPEQISAAARAAVEEKDAAKASEAIRALIETEYQKRDVELQERNDYENGRALAHQFLRNHLHDYNDCEANKQALLDYIKENQLDFTLDNLEAAFEDLNESGKLVKVKTFANTPAIAVANPTAVAAVAAPASPAIPVAEPPAAVPVPAAPQTVAPSQPAAETTVSTPAAAVNVQQTARRPGVGGSIAPGSLSAQRPGAPDPALARKEFLKTVRDMKPDVMKLKIKTDPQFVKDLRAAGIKV